MTLYPEFVQRQVARNIDATMAVLSSLRAHAHLGLACNAPGAPFSWGAQAIEDAVEVVMESIWCVQRDQVPARYRSLLGREVLVTTGGSTCAGRILYLIARVDRWEAVTDEGITIPLDDTSVWEPYRRGGADV